MALSPYPWLRDPEEALLKMRGAMPNAILLYGAPGTGVYELALAFAKSLFCLEPNPDGTPCGRCTGCRLTQAGTHPDFKQVLSEAMCARYEVPYEAAENERPEQKKKLSREVRIHQIRVLSDFLSLNSNQGGRRVVLVYPADKVRAEASASLLKSMEEPPEGLTWILAAEKLDDVLPTIRSRSRLVRVPTPSFQEALEFLKAKKVRNAEELLRLAGGAPLSVLDAGEDEKLSSGTEELILGFLRSGKELNLDALTRAAPRDMSIPAFSLLAARWAHDLMLATFALPPRYFVKEAETLKTLAARTSPKKAAVFCDLALSARRAADHPLSVRQVWETLLIRYQQIF